MDQQDDAAKTKKDDENKAAPTGKVLILGNIGDTSDITDVNIDFLNPVLPPSIKADQIDENNKLVVDTIKSPIKATTVETHDKNNTVYKQIVIDNVSDSDLKSHWTDDDNQMQPNIQPLNDKELEILDEEHITPSQIGTQHDKKIQNISQDFVVDKSSKPIEKHIKTVDLDININQALSVANDGKSVGGIHKSEESDKVNQNLDQTVEELQQLIDCDDVIEQILDTVMEEKTSGKENLIIKEVIRNVGKSAMNISEASLVEVKSDLDNSEMLKISKDSMDMSDCVNNQTEKLLHNSDVNKEPIFQLAKTINVDDENVNIEEIDTGLPSKIEDSQTIPVINDENVTSEKVNILASEIPNNDSVTEIEETLVQIETKEKHYKGNDDKAILTPLLKDITKECNADSVNESNAIASNIQKDTSNNNINNTDVKINDDVIEIDEFLTPHLKDDSSIRINTEHRLNRPDVMLDIPTQEFDLDEFDDASDMMEHSPISTTENKECSNMIEKTVTDIVNQLARDDEEEKKSVHDETDRISNVNEDNSKTRHDKMDTTNDAISTLDMKISTFTIAKCSTETTNTLLQEQISTTDSQPKNDSQVIPTGSQCSKETLECSISELSSDNTTDQQKEKYVDSNTTVCAVSEESVNKQEEKHTKSGGLVKPLSTALLAENKNEKPKDNHNENVLENGRMVHELSPENLIEVEPKSCKFGAFNESNPNPKEPSTAILKDLHDNKDTEKYLEKVKVSTNILPSKEEKATENIKEQIQTNTLVNEQNTVEMSSKSIKEQKSETTIEKGLLKNNDIQEPGQKLKHTEDEFDVPLLTSPAVTQKIDIRLTKSNTDVKVNKCSTDCILKIDVQPSTSAIDVQPSTSTSDNTDKTDVNLKTSNVEIKNHTDVQPAISDVKNVDSDHSDDVQEVTQDSLGLLAESSRVIDDDDEQEQEEDEVDDAEGEDEDDEDFDPDDEESSNQHSEESNPANSELDIRGKGMFGNRKGAIEMADSNDANDGFIADDITIEDEPLPLEPLKTELPEENIVPKSKKSAISKKTSVVRRNSILSDLLTKPTRLDEIKFADKNKSSGVLSSEISSKSIVNIVDLGSSSEDDTHTNIEAKKDAPRSEPETNLDKNVKNVPKSETDKNSEESVEVAKEAKNDKGKSKPGEVFSLDSDEDNSSVESKDVEDILQPSNNQCINHNCTSDYTMPYYLADRVTIAYYGAARRRKRAVCQSCLNIVITRNQGLLNGIKDMIPLMSLRMARPRQQLLEISDSDSEGEDDPVGDVGAKILEEHLADLINETWKKYKMDDRLKETEDCLQAELKKMESQSQQIDKLLKDCQKATDNLRVELYAGFEPTRKELPSLSMHDTPIASYACLESEEETHVIPQVNVRYPKRRSSSTMDTPASKKLALPAPYTDDKTEHSGNNHIISGPKEEDKDVSVVRLTAESAPTDLPPAGELTRPPLKAGAQVYAMKNPYGAWLEAKLLEVLPKSPDQQFTQCRVCFEHKTKNLMGKVVAGRCIAYTEPCNVRMTIGTRVIALFKNADNGTKRQSFFYSGIIAEIPNPVNSYRYLVFFDDGYVQYVQHCDVRLVYESSPLVWEEVHPFSRDFVCNYLLKYPERPMVRMHTGQSLVVEYNGKWLETKVIEVDAAVVKVQFAENRVEWIYRGSTRLQPLFVEFQAARRGDRARLPRSTKQNTKTNMPYVEYTRSDEQAKNNEQQQPQSPMEELRRQRAVAKKSTTAMPQMVNPTTDVVSRVVFYTPKNSVRPYKMVPHTCGPQCKRSDLLSLKELRTYNPLTKPLLSGWERQIIRHKYSRAVMYRAPCGRRLRGMSELHAYLRAARSDMPVDLFDFNPNTHCLAEFVLNKTNVHKKDLSHGKENVPVPCVNYYDHSLPEFCSYNTERTPTAGVPLNLDPEFLCGCDCDDDCADKTKCACWKMTLEGAHTIGMEGNDIGYEYRRLPEPLPSGIYECNSRCKCKSTCLNRVVQNPLQLKLQVFKTLNRGWGIRALNDVPKGAFLCIYAGNLLTDATANLDGLNEGDEYLAELDYIEVVESMKEGYEDDIPEADKKLDKKERVTKNVESEPESESSESEDEEKHSRKDEVDDDFHPTTNFGMKLTEFNKRLRRRDKNKKNNEQNNEDKEQTGQEKEIEKTEDGDDCITISDDEEVRVSTREPARFTAQEVMTDSKVVPKYRSIRTYFGRDEACYIMDAKVQGNIGRYLNHSCSPNVFVQNVFVDTHDPRFPWVSFFALHHIRAGTELTWNYNYDIGSVPGKVLYCFCGAPNCRGRLL